MNASQEKLGGSKGVQLPSIPSDLEIWLEPKALRTGTLNDNEEVNIYVNRAKKCSIGEGVRSRYSLSPERRKNSWQLYFNPTAHIYSIEATIISIKVKSIKFHC